MKIIFLFLILFFVSCSVHNRDWYLIKNMNQISKHVPFGYTSGYVNNEGDTIVQLDTYARCYTDTVKNYAIVYSKKLGLVGIDKNQNVLFNAEWCDVDTPCLENDGLILIIKNNKYGYANHKGETIIIPQFKCATNFYEGKAKVSYKCSETTDEHIRWSSSSWFYIDKKGNKVNNN